MSDPLGDGLRSDGGEGHMPDVETVSGTREVEECRAGFDLPPPVDDFVQVWGRPTLTSGTSNLSATLLGIRP